MQLTVIPLGDDGVAVLPRDISWNGVVGDFAVSTAPADGGVGGLMARDPLATAHLLLLFTDVRVSADDPRLARLGGSGVDRRGWVDDGFDVRTSAGEAPLGSKLWLYRRAVLVARTFGEIEAEIRVALQPLIVQGAVARIDVSGTVEPARNLVRASIASYGRDNRQLYSASFDPLWRRTDGL